MAPPTQLQTLVERFDSHRESYLSGKYNETQVRREFIDPLFKLLGWDIDNKEGYAEAYKDVVHEDSLKIGGATTAPDYCFRIGGTRKFFLEAKRPSVNIKNDTDPAFQLRRYAWSAKLPLSVLTDFEEFAVYDCRVKPAKNDKASAARTMYLTYRDYLENWDQIAGIFHRESVLKGSFDKYADSAKRKKGTAEVDAAFLKEIESWREALAKNVALRNPRLGQRELNFAVQRIVDRIIFLRICEDRGVEVYGRMLGLMNGTMMYERLCTFFREADDRYNSGLFHFHEGKDRPTPPDALTLDLKVDDKILKEIFKSLYYPDSPYEFSVLPVEILGQVYEQFLGKVIRLSKGHRAVVEEKPEVKKAGGVYYTPGYIVDYIVKNTVGKLLAVKKPGKAADKIKILDPACGSGSFLLGAYKYLLDWYRDHYEKADSKTRKKFLYQAQGGEWRLVAEERKRILLTHIYGVDVDPQAVEVSKLSLLLKVLEGETDDTLKRQFLLFHERALPDLGANIKCGNSLVGPDYYDRPQMAFSFDDEERYRINAFDWQSEFPEIMKRGGFDAVVGNPPYVRQETLGDLKEYFQEKFAVYHGMADLYAYFIERGVSLLDKGGVFSYIVSNKWMRAGYGEPLRRWMKERCIEEIVDFGDLPVFEKATTYPCILRIAQRAPDAELRVAELKTLDFDDLGDCVVKNRYEIKRDQLDDKGWSLADPSTQKLLAKLKGVGVPLKEYVDGKIYYGIKTGLNEAFVIDAETRKRLIEEDPKSQELIKPFLAGKDIKRYVPPKAKRFLIFTRRGVDVKKYPAIEKHLLQFKKRLMPKPVNWKPKNQDDKWPGRKPGSYKWYEIQDSIDYYEEFEKPKIIWPGISLEVNGFSFDDFANFGNDNNQLIISSDKFLLGILCSKVIKFLLLNICDKVQGGFYRLKIIYIQDIPIYQFVDSNDNSRLHDKMVRLVEGMLGLNGKLAEAKTLHDQTLLKRQIDATDGQIDQLVYELYGLTAEEIRIVEDATQPG